MVRDTYAVARTRWIFLRGLAVIFLVAFVSLWSQLDGLIGSRGILPAAELMSQAADQIPGRVDLLPTLAWFSSSDVFLHALCAAGVVVSLLALIGVGEAVLFFILWLVYLSLTIVSSEFLSFQWDNLLLETGFLAVFFAPCSWRPRWTQKTEPPVVTLWLLRWLLFRLMFQSGLVKLLSHDPTWRNLTALQYHFETQPLPTWIGWYAHQLQSAVLKTMTGAMFFVELVVPFFIFLGRRFRIATGILFIGFQIIIGATGNYGFFNLNSILLCVLLFDDACFQRKERPKEAVPGEPRAVRAPRKLPFSKFARVISFPLVALILTVSSAEMARRVFGRSEMPGILNDVLAAVAPFRTINSYGLFAVMTTRRLEIEVEGSLDGQNWKTYDFQWKPGALNRRPAFQEPHMPRLDWQMWFAALAPCEHSPWFERFEQKILQGSPAVLRLLKSDPFAGQRPAMIRTSLYDYHFTDPVTKSADGTWWRRDYRGEYCPFLSNPSN